MEANLYSFLKLRQEAVDSLLSSVNIDMNSIKVTSLLFIDDLKITKTALILMKINGNEVEGSIHFTLSDSDKIKHSSNPEQEFLSMFREKVAEMISKFMTDGFQISDSPQFANFYDAFLK